jgi:predicted ribosome quality control (RQC) complex YloA/Tae2 family protein
LLLLGVGGKMFTGIVLHYLLKELDIKGKVKIDDIVRSENEISVVFKKQFLTANLSSKAPYISFKQIKGQGYFSSVFKGKEINKIEQLGLDRILIISLEEDLKIVFEIFGRRSDCLFLRGDEILNSFKGLKKDTYKLPPISKALNLLEAGKDELVDAMIGGEKISGLSVGFIKNLKMKGIEFVDSFAEREFGPTVFEDILSPFVLPGGRGCPSMNEAITYYFEVKNKEEERKRLKEIIETELDKKIYRDEEILRRLSEPKDISVYKQMGDALLTYQGYIDFSKDKVILDYMNRKLEIVIDSSLSVMKNAQHYFELFKKEKRKSESEEQRKKKVEKELNVLKKKREKLKTTDDLTEFKEFYKKEKETEEEVIPSKFKVFTTRNGFKVLVGKNAEANQELTFSYARPYDIFFHVKNAPGSHTILRLKDKNKFPPIEDIYEAAYYAAKFSKLKHSTSVPVSYALKRYVRGAKGLAKGTVIMEREKVVYVNAGD